MQGRVRNEGLRAGASGRVGRERAVDGLLFCGILSSLLYVATDVIAAFRYKGYGYASQTVSELFAIGAPTRPLVVSLFIPYNLLLTAFGVGIWASAGRKRAARLTAASLIASAALGMAGPFVPMHQRGARRTLTDTMHVALTAVLSLFILLATGFGATLHGRRFRWYSIGTGLTLLVFGGWASLDAPRLVARQPTPWMGAKERINIYAYLLWVLALAISLLRARGGLVPGREGRG